MHFCAGRFPTRPRLLSFSTPEGLCDTLLRVVNTGSGFGIQINYSSGICMGAILEGGPLKFWVFRPPPPLSAFRKVLYCRSMQPPLLCPLFRTCSPSLCRRPLSIAPYGLIPELNVFATQTPLLCYRLLQQQHTE